MFPRLGRQRLRGGGQPRNESHEKDRALPRETATQPAPEAIVLFWQEAGPEAWFHKSDAFDAAIREGFEALHFQAARGEFARWVEQPVPALALLLLTDQFPRNLFRASAHAFATDPMAIAGVERSLSLGHDATVMPVLRPFFYLPFEHHEDEASQARSVALFSAHARATGDGESLRWAEEHARIIGRFGRFPHRNAALGRVTTAEERRFLDEGGFAG